jgi:hypothetical protein
MVRTRFVIYRLQGCVLSTDSALTLALPDDARAEFRDELTA